MSKFRYDERLQIKNIVASLIITRLSDIEIAKEIERQTGKSISLKQIYNIRQQIKKDSYDWYMKLRSNQYEYLHEFKERINEITSLQQIHHEIIKENRHKNPSIVQTSLAELHKLSITLSNLFDVAPSIINGITLSNTSKDNSSPTEEQESEHTEPHVQAYDDYYKTKSVGNSTLAFNPS